MKEDKLEKALYEKLINTFQKYPTKIQDTLLRLIYIRLNELNSDIDNFTKEILEPDITRYDILKSKASQFNFELDTKYSLREQLNVLNSIYEVYSKRGSVDSIENMHKYYGRDLPKNVTVQVPASELFRYSVSKLSGTDKFQDGVYYRAGVYTIIIDGEYDLDKVREFVLHELVTAGRKVNFNKKIFSYLLGDFSTYKIKSDHTISIFSRLNINKSGLIWSTSSAPYKLSGSSNLYVNIHWPIQLVKVKIEYIVNEIVRTIVWKFKNSPLIKFNLFRSLHDRTTITINTLMDGTNVNEQTRSSIHYYTREGEIIPSSTSGYFILGKTKLKGVTIRNEN